VLKPLTTTSLRSSPPAQCPYCQSSRIIKKGKRRNKLAEVQLWYCKQCQTIFTASPSRNATYPLPVILSGISYYNEGFTLGESARLIKSDFRIAVPRSTIASWLSTYKDIATYHRLRDQIRKNFSPHNVIKSISLYHQQVYSFRIHAGKLARLLETPEQRLSVPLSDFLDTMFRHCPNRLFAASARASQFKTRIPLNDAAVLHKTNTATRIARLVLPTAGRNIQRHETIQKFMLINDSVTVGVEVPIYLTPEDIAHLEGKLGFSLPFHLETTATGHIDFVQIRNGLIHILDYKPNAKHERPFQQLLLYALALSRLTGLRLYDFKCAWFDENDYYEFFPLHLVYHSKKDDYYASQDSRPQVPR